jgi:hypothetical protein
MKKTPQNSLFIWIAYGLLITALTIYSFSQIDLNLTLSNNHNYQIFQNLLIQLGYYQRPLSTGIFLGILGTLMVMYFWMIHLAGKKMIELRGVIGIIGVTLMLVLAYPAFSHDIFNYMFDAKIVTNYHLNPYFFKAGDFVSDPWIRFMHWTHRYYPYGPTWLLVSLVPSFIGMGKFVFTLGLFKLMFAGFHILNVFLIYQILVKLKSKNPLSGIIFYAFNPLILVESLVSPHNEVMMLTGVLFSIYFIANHKQLLASVSFLLAVGIKFVNIVLLPIYLIFLKDLRKLINYSFYFWLIAIIPLVIQREIYAWYLIPLVGLAAISEGKIIQSLTFGISIGATLRYWPFLLYGDSNFSTIYLQNISFIIGSGFAAAVYFLWSRKQQSSY